MASKSFTLADSSESGGGCGKICLYTCLLTLVAIIAGAGYYVYQATYGSVCSYPELDESGLSNWTSGGDYVAFGCFPGYFLEGESNLVVAKCEKGMWSPPPPACNALPIRLNCQVNNNSLLGDISMWQETADSPAFIHGLINYTEAVKPQGHIMEHILISKRTCNVTHTGTAKNESDKFPEPEKGSRVLKIQFNSTDLKAYRKAEVFINMIFVDKNTTATLVSVHQEKLTLVMAGSDNSLKNSTWNWVKGNRHLRGALNHGHHEYEDANMEPAQ